MTININSYINSNINININIDIAIKINIIMMMMITCPSGASLPISPSLQARRAAHPPPSLLHHDYVDDNDDDHADDHEDDAADDHDDERIW